MITDADEFFVRGCGRCSRFGTPECSIHPWIDGLVHLRKICLGAGLEETVKWAHPTYMHSSRNIAILGAFRNDFRISFMNASLLRDDKGVLEPQGPNSPTPGMLRFSDVAQVGDRKRSIQGFLRQLMDHAEAGTKPPKVVTDIDMPSELSEALDGDPELAEAFHALTPGRQKSYLFNISQARQSATRFARIEKFRDKIIAGKGAPER